MPTTRPSLAESSPRRVSLFRNGANQAVRIPREFELPSKEALLFREGDRLVIEAYPKPPSLLSVLDGLDSIDETFPNIDDTLPPVESVEL